jgi:hypothetical protein
LNGHVLDRLSRLSRLDLHVLDRLSGLSGLNGHVLERLPRLSRLDLHVLNGRLNRRDRGLSAGHRLCRRLAVLVVDRVLEAP